MEESGGSSQPKNTQTPNPTVVANLNVQASPKQPAQAQAVEQVVNNQTSQQQQAAHQTTEKAGFLLRSAANAVDTLLITLLFLPVLFLFPDLTENGLNLIISIFVMLYMTLAIGLYGRTFGKKYCHLRVVPVEGGKVGFGHAFLREVLGKILSSLVLSLGYLWVIWDKDKQGWHDKIAKTYVVVEKPLSRGRKIIMYLVVFGLPTLAILGVLAVVILVAINPAEQLERARRQQEKMELEYETRQGELDLIEQGPVLYD